MAERKITSQRVMLGQGLVNLPTLPALYIGSEGSSTLVTIPSEVGERTDKLGGD